MTDGIVLSLFDYTGNMVKPWAKNGYHCYCVDLKHIDNERVEEFEGGGKINFVGSDIHEFLPPREEYRIVFAFPPCTDISVSGARWFKDKGLAGLGDAIKNVGKARDICEWADAPWLIENPISVLSTHWREPDFIFHPYEYDGYTEDNDSYQKATCLWTSNGFVMPEQERERERYGN